MPALEVVDFIHNAVLWEITGRDKFAQPILDNPIQIRCRWIDTKKEAVDAQGNTVAIDAQVYIAIDIPIGSMMWKGKLTELLGTDLIPPRDAMQVISFPKTPDLKGRNYRRMVSLMRFGNTLPSA